MSTSLFPLRLKIPFLVTFSGGSPYCAIKSETKKVCTHPAENSESHPDWNEAFLFYRKNPQQPLKITLWNKTLTIDAFLGQSNISTLDPFDELTLKLTGRRGKATEDVPGKIRILVENFENLEEI